MLSLQVIQLHNAFLSAALERSLLLHAEVVKHIHMLLAAAKKLSNVVGSTGEDLRRLVVKVRESVSQLGSRAVSACRNHQLHVSRCAGKLTGQALATAPTMASANTPLRPCCVC